MKSAADVKDRSTGARLVQNPLEPLVESPASVYLVGIGIGIAFGGLFLLLLGALTF